MSPALRLGVAGPVGTGKSSLIALICGALAGQRSIAVVTNDIYTDEDARFLRAAGVLEPERIRAVETGACPHTAIRDDVTANLLVVEDLEAEFNPDIVLVESGGDNLTATFSPALVDAQIFVLDVAGGGDVARKGGPGIARADLLVVNKTDLGPYVGVDVAQMVADAEAARDSRPVIALSKNDPASVAKLAAWVEYVLQAKRSGAHTPTDPGPMAPHFHAEEGTWHTHDQPATTSPRHPGPVPGSPDEVRQRGRDDATSTRHPGLVPGSPDEVRQRERDDATSTRHPGLVPGSPDEVRQRERT
jgi:urease accessory protein